LVCQPEELPPGWLLVSVKKYSTGPVASVPTIAVHGHDRWPVAIGATANVAGLGVGASVSGAAPALKVAMDAAQ